MSRAIENRLENSTVNSFDNSEANTENREFAYDTDYAYDWSRALESSIENSSTTDNSRHTGYDTSYEHIYDTDYAYDMSRAIENRLENSTVNTFDNSEANTENREFAYDMSRAIDNTSEVFNPEKNAAASIPDALLRLFKQTQTSETNAGERRTQITEHENTERIFQQLDRAASTPPSEEIIYGDTFSNSYANSDSIDYDYDMSKAVTNAIDNSSANSYDNGNTISESADTAFNTAYSYLWNREPGETGNGVISVSAILPEALEMLLGREERYIEEAARPEDAGSAAAGLGAAAREISWPDGYSAIVGENLSPWPENEPLSGALEQFPQGGAPETLFELPEALAFRSEEAERDIGGIQERPIETEGEPTRDRIVESRAPAGSGTEDTKRIFLEINGTGAIEIGSRTDRDEVLEILEENIRPVLVGILEQEIYEEGERSYEF